MITLLKKNIWKKTILKKTASIKQAIKSLEISSTQIEQTPKSGVSSIYLQLLLMEILEEQC